MSFPHFQVSIKRIPDTVNNIILCLYHFSINIKSLGSCYFKSSAIFLAFYLLYITINNGFNPHLTSTVASKGITSFHTFINTFA